MINNQYNAKQKNKRASLAAYKQNLQPNGKKSLEGGPALNYKNNKTPRKIEFSTLTGPPQQGQGPDWCTWNLESSEFPEFSGPTEVAFSSLSKASTVPVAWWQCRVFCLLHSKETVFPSPCPQDLSLPLLQATRPIIRVKLHHESTETC